MKLAVEAPGKVNLCLFLGPLREDGRHELVTLIESVSLSDRLTISTSQTDEVHCAGVPEPNLVTLALQALRASNWDGPPLRVEIDKRIPVAGGMGGGSADAAALLRAAHHLSPLPKQTLDRIAAQLGADVPSQLQPGVSLATGAGDNLEQAPKLQPHAFVIVSQTAPLSTAEVYAQADRLGLPRPAAELKTLREQLLQTNAPPITNDLAPATLSLRPEVEDALKAIRATDADHALVSGSGPTTFGLFWGPNAEQRAQESAQQLSRRFPGTVVAVPVDRDAGRPLELA
jgi:4-diphosphocytidyl-2-C-methyl-D-erythritol kinase